MRKFILSSILMSIGFLITVSIYQYFKQQWLGGDSSSERNLTNPQIWSAIMGETIRAVLTSWLYMYHNKKGFSIGKTIKFGLVCSGLIGSIWLIVGAEFLNHTDKLSFIIDDGIILVLQGLIAGIVLWLIYKKEERSVLNKGRYD
ncbi:MAG: hypothetical protein AAFX55_19375 [Bacteroidota bacterium]